MARFPCSRCGQRYRGPQQTAYPAFVQGATSMSERMRLCPECFDAVIGSAWLALVGGSRDDSPGRGCTRCGSADGATVVFVPYYETGQERQDLYGRLCSECLSAGLRHVFGAQEVQQRLLEPKELGRALRWEETER